jgi:glycosyltransferase involved in cell wall biosynthesis
MIVKNETKVLPRLFRSLKDYIDYYVIVDTGSTDDTIAFIKREMAGYSIDGEVHERPWVNFGVNRQQALELAIEAGKADWLLFIDADEELGVDDPKFYEKLEPGVSYDIQKRHSGTRYCVPHLLNIKTGRFKWQGPVHNYVEVLEGPKQRPLLEGVWIIYHALQGAKSHGMSTEEKYLRDARLLEQHLEQHPDNARSQFYLAQSYKDAGHLERAYEEYRKRAEMKGWAEETYVARLEMGKVAVAMDQPEEVIVRDLLAAFEARPSRAEPAYHLARYFRSKKQYGKAFLFAKAGVSNSTPKDALFVAQRVYDWQLLDELGVAAYWIEEYEVCKAACQEVLRRIEQGIEVPDEDAQRVRDNLAFANQKLQGNSPD